jgi:hypothetical protein
METSAREMVNIEETFARTWFFSDMGGVDRQALDDAGHIPLHPGRCWPPQSLSAGLWRPVVSMPRAPLATPDPASQHTQRRALSRSPRWRKRSAAWSLRNGRGKPPNAAGSGRGSSAGDQPCWGSCVDSCPRLAYRGFTASRGGGVWEGATLDFGHGGREGTGMGTVMERRKWSPSLAKGAEAAWYGIMAKGVRGMRNRFDRYWWHGGMAPQTSFSRVQAVRHLAKLHQPFDSIQMSSLTPVTVPSTSATLFTVGEPYLR